MSRHKSGRIHYHSLFFWLTPLLLCGAVAVAAFFLQPEIKEAVDHVLILARLLF